MKHNLRKMPPGKGARTAILSVAGAVFFDGKLSLGYSGQAVS
jgi:hypothetical protein